MAALAAGVAVGVVGGMVAAEVVDEIGDAFEYAAYLRQRTAGAPGVRADRASSAASGVRGLLTALAVLAPVLAAAATAVFLLLGYVLGLGHSGRELGDALLTAGQTAAVITAVTTGCGVAWLLRTAARHRTPAPGPLSGAPGVAEAREAWRRALLERGVLPYLRAQLRRTGPNRTGPNRTGPHQAEGKEGESQKNPIQP